MTSKANVDQAACVVSLVAWLLQQGIMEDPSLHPIEMTCLVSQVWLVLVRS